MEVAGRRPKKRIRLKLPDSSPPLPFHGYARGPGIFLSPFSYSLPYGFKSFRPHETQTGPGRFSLESFFDFQETCFDQHVFPATVEKTPLEYFPDSSSFSTPPPPPTSLPAATLPFLWFVYVVTLFATSRTPHILFSLWPLAHINITSLRRSFPAGRQVYPPGPLLALIHSLSK